MGREIGSLALGVIARLFLAPEASWQDVSSRDIWQFLSGATMLGVCGYAYCQFYKWTLTPNDRGPATPRTAEPPMAAAIRSADEADPGR